MSLKNIFDQFNIDNPVLPKAIKKGALHSGNFPYAKKLKREAYDAELSKLHLELVKLQSHLQNSKQRIAIVFEGRDSAGKGGAIKTYLQNISPRHNRIIALPKPSDRERSQWYFQRYARHLPASGESVLFDRSWYNRAGVEPVMGFGTPEQTKHFLREAPNFEKMIVDDNIHFFKFWLNIGREMQLKRFHDRRHNPLKMWKLSPIDIEALNKWDDYSTARNKMLEATNTRHAPWTVILANDKKRARLEVMRSVLSRLEYEDKEPKNIGNIDVKINMNGKKFLSSRSCNDEG